MIRYLTGFRTGGGGLIEYTTRRFQNPEEDLQRQQGACGSLAVASRDLTAHLLHGTAF